MRPRSIPVDTEPDVFDLLVARWTSMTIPERVALVDQINADVELLAIAGIHADHPGLTDVGVRRELARRRYGSQLADEAYRHLDN